MEDEAMKTRRPVRLIVACLMFAGGIAMSAGPSIAVGAERPSEAQILNALKPSAKMRNLTAGQQDPEEQRFLDEVRAVKSRSLTVDERHKVAVIAKQRPSIDLGRQRRG
jgi:hypothetical protein